MKWMLPQCAKATLISLALTLAFSAVPALAKSRTINGAGATFPFPVYSQWAYQYHRVAKVRLNYQSIGSGGGIRQIKAKTVDFGASDAPLTPADLAAAGLMQFPMIMGGVVPVANVPGIRAGQLKLSGQVLADIFQGKITQWNDTRIQAENRGIRLPDRAITVVHRSDGSGTTWIFTNYLAKVSASWAKAIGNNKAVHWPAGVGGKGNEGVASYVQRIKGAIGYVEYAYARQNKMTYVLLQNRAGHFVAPTSKTFQAAADGADWAHAQGYYLVLTDQPGQDSWPITGASFILMYRNQLKPETAERVLAFFDWCYKNGAEIANKLDYVPMPDKVVNMVENSWRKELSAAGKPIWK